MTSTVPSLSEADFNAIIKTSNDKFVLDSLKASQEGLVLFKIFSDCFVQLSEKVYSQIDALIESNRLSASSSSAKSSSRSSGTVKLVRKDNLEHKITIHYDKPVVQSKFKKNRYILNSGFIAPGETELVLGIQSELASFDTNEQFGQVEEWIVSGTQQYLKDCSLIHDGTDLFVEVNDSNSLPVPKRFNGLLLKITDGTISGEYFPIYDIVNSNKIVLYGESTLGKSLIAGDGLDGLNCEIVGFDVLGLQVVQDSPISGGNDDSLDFCAYRHGIVRSGNDTDSDLRTKIVLKRSHVDVSSIISIVYSVDSRIEDVFAWEFNSNQNTSITRSLSLPQNSILPGRSFITASPIQVMPSEMEHFGCAFVSNGSKRFVLDVTLNEDSSISKDICLDIMIKIKEALRNRTALGVSYGIYMKQLIPFL